MPPAADSPIGKAVQKVAGSKVFADIGSKIVPPIDRLVSKLTGGRIVISAGMVPSLVLTVKGRKSGQPRRTPLATLPIDDGFLVVGSNFGKEHHPAWTANLMANPEASVSFKGEDIPVVAHLLDPEEKRAVWPKLLEIWPTYDRYVERSGRDLCVFKLNRRSGDD